MKKDITELKKILKVNGFIIDKEENYIIVKNEVLVTTWHFNNENSMYKYFNRNIDNLIHLIKIIKLNK